MGVFVYPPQDKKPWPTLGPQVCAWIEECLCYGPGDLLGQPIELDDETRAWLYKFYELFPAKLERRKKKTIVRSAHPNAGKRRFTRCALSLPKGSAKTELAAWIAAAELHPEAPVRFGGFSKNGEPLDGIPVTDPYIPMIAYTEEQTEELAYGALRRILEECDVGNDLDIGLERILRIHGDGKAEAVSGSPNARDGARTTFQHADESHRLVLDSQKRAWQVMLANLAKRPIADPWALETTTAPEPGAGSVAEATMHHAQELAKSKEPGRMFFYHREASETHDLTTKKGLAAAITEARGPYRSSWTDVDRIVALFRDPDADLAYLERVWTNRLVKSTVKAFDSIRWRELAQDHTVPVGAIITLGFDGSRYDDATALVGTELETGYQWPLGIWERPLTSVDWEIPVEEVDATVRDVFETYEVVRMYADPPKWESWIAQWAGSFGEKIVVEWWTSRRKPMCYAVRSYLMAITAGELSHSGDEQMAQHIGNCCKYYTNLYDEDEKQLWMLKKDRPDSPRKIDAAMAGILSWEARNDAVASGILSNLREPGDIGITVGNYG